MCTDIKQTFKCIAATYWAGVSVSPVIIQVTVTVASDFPTCSEKLQCDLVITFFDLEFDPRPLPPPTLLQVYSEDSSIVIFDALAGHVHQVQVRARDEVNSDTQWSEWTPVSLARTWQGEVENK